MPSTLPDDALLREAARLVRVDGHNAFEASLCFGRDATCPANGGASVSHGAGAASGPSG